jgi:endonuclease/exonuclease/phosphatase family metal-dependent hydrolase
MSSLVPLPANSPSTVPAHRFSLPIFVRNLVIAAISCYTLALTLLFLAMEFTGERLWPVAILLYVPQGLFLLPLIILIPAALLVDAPPRSWITLVFSGIIFLWHVPFYLGISGGSAHPALKVITNNYAQNHHLSLQPFIDAVDPDFVALQDSANQGPFFQHLYSSRYVRSVGQFVLISKTPILGATPLMWPLWRGGPVAALFNVQWQGREIDLYAVHLPTPRSDFAKLTGLGIAREILGRNRRRSDNMSFAESMTARVQLARDLASVISHEQRPFLLMGDFNMPSNGAVHHILTAGLQDCFAQTGRGFGFTFPCDTANPITLGQPWLRLDYVLAGPGWHVEDCYVEPGRRSKHRAVTATLSLN